MVNETLLSLPVSSNDLKFVVEIKFKNGTQKVIEFENLDGGVLSI